MAADNEGYFVSFIDGDLEEKQILRDSLFVGEVAAWAGRRVKILGDLIIPKQVYIEWSDEQPHNVFWVEHFGLDPRTEERFHKHHVVCDCVTSRRFDDGNQGVDTSVCEVLQSALTARAQLVDEQYSVSTLLEQTDLPMLGKPEDPHNVALNAVKNILNWDRHYPEKWFGNPVSGEHQVPLIGEILDRPPEVVRLYADILQLNGELEVQGDTMRLAA
jgi:hypothetical protein